jgi:rhodanese-related sulfurtransferase
MVVSEGRRRSALEAQVPIAPRELYRTLAKGKSAVQVVDVRPDLGAGFEEARVPGALPMPGCALATTPEKARSRIVPSAPTVVVTASGDPAEAAACAGFFTSARLLAGGMEAWSDASLPEDSGEYTPPSTKAGGGCL